MHHYEEFLDQTSPRHFLPLFPSMHTKMGVAPLVTKLHSSISKKKIIMIYLGILKVVMAYFKMREIIVA